jgi:hypothetical protein
LILNPIAGHTLVTDLESLAFMGHWIFTTLVGGVHQVRDIDRVVLLQEVRDGRVWRLRASFRLTVRQGRL